MFTGYMLHVLQVTCSNTQVTCFTCSNTRFTWAYVTFLSQWFLISLALGKLRLNINFMCFVRDFFYRILLFTMFPLLSAKTSNKRSHSDYNQRLPFRGGCRTAAASKMELIVIIVNGFYYHKMLYLWCFRHPVQVPRWPSNFAPGIKTKLKDFSGEI